MRLRFALATTCATLALTACAPTVPAQTEATRADADQAMSALDAADRIEVRKDIVSIGDSWSIRVDGDEVARIEGLDLKAFGDTYTMVSPAGGIMGGEEEQIMTVAKTATMFDENLDPTGTLRKEIFSLMARYNLVDNEGDFVATMEQKFSLGLKASIEDKDGIVWEVRRDIMAVTPNIVFTRQDQDSSLSTMDAILMGVVASEVYDAEQQN